MAQLQRREPSPIYYGIKDVSVFEKIRQIGDGTHSKVYMARNRATGEIVALKKVKMEKERQGFPITALREIKILTCLSHPNVIKLKEVTGLFQFPGPTKDTQTGQPEEGRAVRERPVAPSAVFLVLEYVEHDLVGLIDTVSSRPERWFSVAQIKCYMKQLFEGLFYLHSNRVIHRDIKGSNLLINNRGELKIADFGLARYTVDTSSYPYTNRVVTLWYRAPELLLGETKYGPAVDVWAAGCVLGELFLRKPLFPGRNELEELDLIFRLCGTPSRENWPDAAQLPFYEMCQSRKAHPRRLLEVFPPDTPREALDLIDKLLVLDPQQRLSVAQALDHDFFWTDPLPALPHSLPQYPGSNQFLVRAQRHNTTAHPTAAVMTTTATTATAAAVVAASHKSAGNSVNGVVVATAAVTVGSVKDDEDDERAATPPSPPRDSDSPTATPAMLLPQPSPSPPPFSELAHHAPARRPLASGPLFTAEQLQHSPSARDGVPREVVHYYQTTTTAFLQHVGIELGVPQVAIATAMVFYHRFYALQSYRRFPRFTIATACLFLALKVEDTPRKLRDVLVVSHKHKALAMAAANASPLPAAPQHAAAAVHAGDTATSSLHHEPPPVIVPPTYIAPLKVPSQAYFAQRDAVLAAELHVLQTLGFQLVVPHPYSPLLGWAKWAGAPRQLVQVAWNFVNDSLRTGLACLQFAPKVVACAAARLAAMYTGSECPAAWWDWWAEPASAVQAAMDAILSVYDAVPVPPADVRREIEAEWADEDTDDPPAEDADAGVADPLPDNPAVQSAAAVTTARRRSGGSLHGSASSAFSADSIVLPGDSADPEGMPRTAPLEEELTSVEQLRNAVKERDKKICSLEAYILAMEKEMRELKRLVTANADSTKTPKVKRVVLLTPEEREVLEERAGESSPAPSPRSASGITIPQ